MMALKELVDEDIFSVSIGNDTDVTNELKEQYYQTGVGFSVDVVCAKNYNDYKKGVSVLDRSKLSKASFDVNMHPFNNVKTYSTNSISDLMINSSLTYKLNMSIGGEASGMSMSIEQGLNSSTSFEYNRYTEKYYSVLDHYIEQFSLSLVDYAKRGQYTDYLSSAYKDSLKYLYDHQSDDEFFKFFQTYGTHLIGSAIFGGRLNTYFSTVTNKVAINDEKVWELSNALKFGVEGVEAKTDAMKTVKNVLGEKATDIEISFTAVAYGGNSFGASSIDNFKENYKTWWDSFNKDNAVAALIGYSDDGLIPLWQMLPAEYSDMAGDMEKAFGEYYKNAYNNIIREFQFSNTVLYGGGSGTIYDPFIISTATHLRNISQNMNAYFKLKNDIDLSAYADWQAIGGHYREHAFNGRLNGEGHAIKNMKRHMEIAENNSRIYFGLFGYVGAKGVVKNLNFEDIQVRVDGPKVNDSKTRVYFGVVAGTLYGTAENVKILSGTFSYDTDTNGNAHVGGIAGYAYKAMIKDCENHIPLVSRRYAATVGGMVGDSAGVNFINCTNNGNLHAYHYIGGYCFAGGMVGQDFVKCESIYYDCKNNGKLEVSGYNCAYNRLCRTGVGATRGGGNSDPLPEPEY
ncbi:MAG: hypothetical protein K2I75_02620 [Clostridiales bacterium]|nr:hypothetical protein [Clostridiales bacterium]